MAAQASVADERDHHQGAISETADVLAEPMHTSA